MLEARIYKYMFFIISVYAFCCNNPFTKDLFGKYGRLTRCDGKGSFGFVTYEDERDAEDAIAAIDGKTLLGQKYVLN